MIIAPKSGKLLSAIVIGLWVAVLLGVCLRIGLNSHSHDVFVTYYDAGRKWIAVAIAVFLHKGLCLQSANRRVLCPVFVVAAIAGRGTLAPDRRCCFRRGDFLVAKGGDTRSDPEIIALAGLSADTPALTW